MTDRLQEIRARLDAATHHGPRDPIGQCWWDAYVAVRNAPLRKNTNWPVIKQDDGSYAIVVSPSVKVVFDD